MTNKALHIKIMLILLSGVGFAQPKAIQHIATTASTENLKKNLYYLASDDLQGRIMGSHGDTLASEFIAAHFAKHKLEAPYENGKSYFQTITAERFNDKTTLYLNGQTIADLDGWTLFPNLPYKFTNLPVILTAFNSVEEWNKQLPAMELSGKAVVISHKIFTDFNRVDSLENALKAKGVQLVIWSGPRTEYTVRMKRSLGFLPHYQEDPTFQDLSPLPELSMVTSRLQELFQADGIKANADFTWAIPGGKPYLQLKTTIGTERLRTLTHVKAPNVIGMIIGTDPDAGAVIISAHHDHDGMDGKTVYYGAIDNASGTVAIMETASLFNKAAKAGYRPKRTIIFASYTGEERGLLGSFYFAAHPVVPVNKTYAVMNIDMLGRPDTLHLKNKATDSLNYAYILVKDTLNRGLRQSLYNANNAVKLNLDTYYEQPKYAPRRIMGSDQYPFYQKGIPFVRIDCGFVKEYHKPGDTADKVNYNLLNQQTQLAFLTLWNMANN